jgi:hypothetical protein
VSQVEMAKTNLVIQMEILGRLLAVVVITIAISAFLLAYLYVSLQVKMLATCLVWLSLLSAVLYYFVLYHEGSFMTKQCLSCCYVC